MAEKNMTQEFRLKKKDKTRNCLTVVINRNESMSKKHKKACRVLNYIDHSLIAISAITAITFPSLVGIPIGITSSTIGLNICVIIAGIKKY